MLRVVADSTVTPVYDPTTLIVLGAFTLIGSIGTAWIAYLSSTHAKKAAQQATEANDAVNHRKPDQPRLFTMVDEMRGEVSKMRGEMADAIHRLDRSLGDLRSDMSLMAGEMRDVQRDVTGLQRDVEERRWDGKTERRVRQVPFVGPDRRKNTEEPR